MKIIIQHIFIFMLIPYLACSQQNIDIGIFETASPAEVEVKLKPGSNISNSFLTNIQFTVRWDSSANVVIVPSSVPPYLITPQGSAINYNGYVYHIFASSPNCALNWNSGQEYVVLSFTFSACVEFELVKDAWTQANNGDYYIELLGVDHTGMLYNPVTNILPKVDIGKDTIICVYQTIELDAANPGSSFLWSNGETTQEIVIDSASLIPGSYLYSVTVTNQYGCSSVDTILIIVDPCTGMNDYLPDRINVFPNPSQGEIFIDTANKFGILHVHVFDLCGIEVRGQNFITPTLDKHVLDLSGLSAGVYLLKLSCNNFSYSERIILMN